MLKVFGVVLSGALLSACGNEDSQMDDYSAFCGETVSVVTDVDQLVGVWSNDADQPLTIESDDGTLTVNTEALNSYQYTFFDDQTYSLYHTRYFPFTVADGFLGFDSHGDHYEGTYKLDDGVIVLSSTSFANTDRLEINQLKADSLTLSSKDFCGSVFSFYPE